MQSGNKYSKDDTILFIYTCPWWVDNVGGKYKQDFLPTTTKVEVAIEHIKNTRPKFISTYPTYLEKIALTGVKLSDYGVETVIIHSEQSNAKQRNMLSKELDVNVLDEYSSEELTRIALECPYHKYHLEEDACFIEIIGKDGKKLEDGQYGIVCGTNLLNTATPIIRYIQGDIAKITKEKNCKCGSNARILEGVQGRSMDCVITETGEEIPASCFMDIAYNWFLIYNIPVHGLRYQFVQRKIGELELYIVKGKYELDCEKIFESLYTLVPKSTAIYITIGNRLPFDNTAKFRPVINLLNGNNKNLKENKIISNITRVKACMWSSNYNKEYEEALNLVENKIKQIRGQTPDLPYSKTKLAEVEINKFFYDGKTVDRIMIVLRSNGCQHYKKNGGCSMCAHLNGSPLKDKITDENYISQWNSILDGSFIENGKDFDLNNYPVVCVYNLGSLLNEEEISRKALSYIFTSLNQYKGVKKVIIESRAEYVKEDILKAIRSVYDGIVEVGIGVESSNKEIRQLCHHKDIDNDNIFKIATDTLHKYNMKALAYVNFKPIFLTEQEAIDDAINTSVDCFSKYGFDAVSIEPTSLQDNSLANYLYLLGKYRVPWLWSLRDIIHGIYNKLNSNLDIRLGGYFDEEVLSGSQGTGFQERNEIFPHTTSINCNYCTKEFVEHIKKFNMTYNVKDLDDVLPCPHCYNLWLDTKNIRDSRNITTRIKDLLKEGGDIHED